MKVATREVDGTLLLDLFGPFPDSNDDRAPTITAIRQALTGRADFVIVLHELEWVRSVDIGLLLRALKEAKVFADGSGPLVRLVAEHERVRSTIRVTVTPFQVFATEDEALSSHS